MKVYFFDKNFNKTLRKKEAVTINIYDNIDPENYDEIMIKIKEKNFEILNNSLHFKMENYKTIKINDLEVEDFIALILEKGKKDSFNEFIYPKNILIEIDDNITMSF
ncbi:MAG: hypothetical protein ACOCV1_08410 [Bacillota bacterium]